MTRPRRRENRTGSVTQLKNGKYRARICVGKRADGKPDQRYHTTRTRPEAKKWLDLKLKEIQEGRVTVDGDQTVSEFLKEWLAEVVKPDKAMGTYVGYEVNVRLHITPYLDNIPLQDLAPEHIQAMVNRERATGQSNRTTQYALSVLKTALKQAVKWRRISRNPAELVDAPRIRRRPATIFTQAQAQLFLATLKGDRLEAFYTAAVALGLRRGEALALKWADVDLEGGTIAIRASLQRLSGVLGLHATKNQTSTRTVLLPRVVIASLREHRKRQLEERLHAKEWVDGDYVFTTTRGTPVEPRNINRHFERILVKAGLGHLREGKEPIRVHDMRHSAASILLAQGVPLHVVSRILGHSSIRTTADTYSHIYPEGFQSAADKMDDALGGG